ncbi:MAG: cyclase family protein [Candidatus Kaiserbacteria bacterium]|nr:cyclase family protein [Candidatus Kaiserbacteria bacterium]
MEPKEIIDISMPLREGMPTYPGTIALTIETKKSATTGSQMSEISIGSHAGTHIDAPLHAFPNGASIDSIPLLSFIGVCRVVDCTASVGSVSKTDLEAKDIQEGERILIKTSNSIRGFSEFYPDFVFVSSEASQYLAEKGVVLVGIDSLSIKQKGSPDNTPHTHLLEKQIPILEGIDLSKAEEGEYTLIAFPLAYIGIDGAPARAVLLR